MNSTDRQLRAGLIRVAHALPKGDAGRKQLLKVVADFDAGSIGKTVPGPTGVSGSEAEQLKGEFTQQENSELQDKKESGKMAKVKVAGAKLVRRMVIAKVAAVLVQGTKLQGRMMVNLQTRSGMETEMAPIRFVASLDNGIVRDFVTVPPVSGSGAFGLLAFYREIVQEAVDMGLVGDGAGATDLMI